MSKFRIALSGMFRRHDGQWNFPGFDVAALCGGDAFDVEQLKNGPILAAQDIRDFDGLILAGDTLPAQALAAGGRMAVVARFGVGYDKVDVAACTQADVALTITPDAVRRPVAVAALTLLLSVAGKVRIKDSLVRRGPAGFAMRTDHMGVGLEGRTLASIGLGNIATEMFRLAEPLGMRHVACDPYASMGAARGHRVELTDLESAIRQADFLCLHCPLTPDTRHLINKERLSMMKPSAFLINTSRGAVVDQAALEDALAAGTIAGAGLDVLDPEPPAADARICGFDNVILSPHALSWTDQGFAAIGAACVDSMRAVANGIVPKNIVNREVLERSGFVARLEARRTS